VPASSLRLTKIDDQLYSSFRAHFAQLNVTRLDVELIKSAEGKAVSLYVYTSDCAVNGLKALCLLVVHLSVRTCASACIRLEAFPDILQLTFGFSLSPLVCFSVMLDSKIPEHVVESE